mgnify:CR=1 FL=1
MADDSRRNGSDDPVGRLLGLGGSRPVPDAASSARVRDAVHAEWRQSVRARRVRRWTLAAGQPAAVAAGVAFTILLPTSAIPPRVPLPGMEARAGVPAPAAVLESATGTDIRMLRPATFEWAPLPPFAPVPSGAVIETGPGTRGALHTPLGVSIRVDVNTRLRVQHPPVVWLDRGAVYVDDPPSNTESGILVVRSRFGEVTHDGTQYEVRLDDRALRVRVREGTARILRDGPNEVVTAGVEVSVGRYGSVRRQAIPTSGPDWAWTLGLARPPAIDGERLDAFLSWVTREMGWSLRFADDALQRESAGTTLHGSIDGLTPDDALKSVLATCGLTYRVREGTLEIGEDTRRGR